MDIVIEDAEDASVEIAYESEKERDERTRLCDKVIHLPTLKGF